METVEKVHNMVLLFKFSGSFTMPSISRLDAGEKKVIPKHLSLVKYTDRRLVLSTCMCILLQFLRAVQLANFFFFNRSDQISLTFSAYKMLLTESLEIE